MKRRSLLSVVFALSFLLVLSLSAGAVEGILVGPEGLPLEGFSNVYIIDGKPQPVYNFAEHTWYDVFIVGTDENGVPICNVAPDPSDNQEQGRDKGNQRRFECFSGTTLVLMADGSAKMIKDIAIGEKVMGYDLAAGRLYLVRGGRQLPDGQERLLHPQRPEGHGGPPVLRQELRPHPGEPRAGSGNDRHDPGPEAIRDALRFQPGEGLRAQEDHPHLRYPCQRARDVL